MTFHSTQSPANFRLGAYPKNMFWNIKTDLFLGKLDR
jgi:hypothetical protein